MKCSEFIRKYMEMGRENPDMSPEERQGRTALLLAPGEEIVSDTTGEKMTQREVMSVYGRNSRELGKAMDAGDYASFVTIIFGQQAKDDQYHAEKEAAEKAEAEAAEGETAETPVQE